MAEKPTYEELEKKIQALERSQRKAKEALAKSQQDKISILDNLVEHVVYHDREMRVVWANQAACKSVNKQREDLIGLHCYEVWPGRDSVCEDCPVMEIHKTGQPQSLEKMTPDGKWWYIAGHPIQDDSGVMVSTEITMDITQQKRAEIQAAAKKRLLEGINRIFHEAITCKTEEELGSVCLRVAEEATSSPFGFIGMLNDEGLLQHIAISDPGRSAWATANPVGHGVLPAVPVQGLYGRVLKGKGFYTNDPASLPDRVGSPPGHPPIDSFVGVPLIYSNKPIGLVAVANRTGGYSEEDVSSLESLAPAMVQALVKKWAEEEIRRSKKSLEQIVKERTADLETQKEILQKILDNIPAMIAFYSRGGVPFLNRNALETIGITREELPFTDIMSRCYPDPRYRREVMKYMAEAPPEWKELRMVVGDGQEIDSLWRNFRLEDGSYIGIGLDVSEQKATEKKMQYYIQALEKTRKKLSRLSSELMLAEKRERKRLGAVLHDEVQQLLVGAKIHLENMENAPDPEGIKKVLGFIIESLKMTRTLTGEMVPRILYERGLASGLEWLCENIRKTNQLHVDSYLDEAVAVEGEDLKVLLFESVRELLFNVSKHARTSSARLQMSKADLGFLQISVSDRGVGFDPARVAEKDLDAVDHFGLFSIQERLEIIGGYMEIESSPGNGAVFNLVVPVDGQMEGSSPVAA